MNRQYLFSGILAVLVSATTLLAQTTLPGGVIPTPLPTPITLQQSFTTGMIGFTTSQTARLNVLNLNPVPSSTSTTQSANCGVQLQFFDNKNTLISESTVSSVAPGAAASFDLPRSAVTSETTPRAEIRGVVVVNPSVTPAASPAAIGFCTVFTTLEIFDATGSTVALTSDTRALGLPIVISVITGLP
jgi:hypothetical protein